MKISSKVECGVIALVDIELHSRNGQAVTISNISERNQISAKYLEQILPSLRQAKLIKGLKGSRGGYVIARSSKNITFREILNALDVTILSDLDIDDAQDSGMRTVLHDCLWSKMAKCVQSFAQNITLYDIAANYSEFLEGNTPEPMYYI